MNSHNYRDDIAACASIAHDTFEGFERTARMAMLSARKPFVVVGDCLRDVEEHGAQSYWLSAHQRRGIEWLASDKGRALWSTLTRDAEVRSAPALALAYATQCPALGLAKGGFLCQLTGIDTGCLDTHNVDRYEIPRGKVRLDKGASAQRKGRQLRAYTDICAALGGSLTLWGAWCEYLATLYPETYASGRAVSELHVTYCKG